MLTLAQVDLTKIADNSMLSGGVIVSFLFALTICVILLWKFAIGPALTLLLSTVKEINALSANVKDAAESLERQKLSMCGQPRTLTPNGT